jgi:hypothetical protein
MKKVQLKSIVILHKTCRVLHKETNKIRFTFFLIFLWIYTNFTSHWTSTLKGKKLFSHMSLETFRSSQLYPRLLTTKPLHKKPSHRCPPAAEASSSPARWGRRGTTNDAKVQFSSPYVDSCAWFDRRCRQWVAAVEQWRRGCDYWISGEVRGGAGQLIAVRAPRRPREGVKGVHWLEMQSKGGVRRGGAMVTATVQTRTRRELGRLLYPAHRGEGASCAPRQPQSQYRQGVGATTCGGPGHQMADGGAASGQWKSFVWHPRSLARIMHRESSAQTTDRWTPTVLGVRVRRRSRRFTPGATSRVRARTGSVLFNLALFDRLKHWILL